MTPRPPLCYSTTHCRNAFRTETSSTQCKIPNTNSPTDVSIPKAGEAKLPIIETTANAPEIIPYVNNKLLLLLIFADFIVSFDFIISTKNHMGESSGTSNSQANHAEEHLRD